MDVTLRIQVEAIGRVRCGYDDESRYFLMARRRFVTATMKAQKRTGASHNTCAGLLQREEFEALSKAEVDAIVNAAYDKRSATAVTWSSRRRRAAALSQCGPGTANLRYRRSFVETKSSWWLLHH
jgi:hypothetical protein